jgi:hypothetical protein
MCNFWCKSQFFVVFGVFGPLKKRSFFGDFWVFSYFWVSNFHAFCCFLSAVGKGQKQAPCKSVKLYSGNRQKSALVHCFDPFGRQRVIFDRKTQKSRKMIKNGVCRKRAQNQGVPLGGQK